MKKIYTVFSFCLISLILFSYETAITNEINPPNGMTSSSSNCTTCHSGNPLNSNTSVSISGLPTSGVGITPGQTYTFSVTISSTQPGRNIWGFEMRAILSGTNTSVGTFIAGPNTQVSGIPTNQYLKHSTAVASTGTSYTYSDLQWQAPSTTVGDIITFEVAGNAGNNNNLISGDFIALFSSSSPLPAVLSHFNVHNNNNVVYLNWQTESEMNVSHFEIERSMNGVDFIKVADEKAVGNSNTPTTYQISDIPTISGKYFYRIKIVDNDSKYKYTQIENVQFNLDNDFAVLITPNPVNASQDIHLQVSNPQSNSLQITIIDIQGKIVKRMTTWVEKNSSNAVTISNNLIKGMYILKIGTERAAFKTYPILIH